MASDLARDLHLGIALSFALAIVLHVVLAFWSLARQRARIDQVFAAANALLAVSLILQGTEFGLAIRAFDLDPATKRGVFGAQLAANLLLIAIFFQMLATFEQRYQRTRSGLRAWITHVLHGGARVAVPTAYALVFLAGLVYLADAAGVGSAAAAVRSAIGPTSAYLFGLSLWVVVFLMFPARPGQEHLAVPVAGRALLLTTLGITIGLIALWHDQRPRVTSEVLLPALHLHGILAAVFLALVRYEFAFMDRFVLGAVRSIVWLGVVLAAYWTFHRIGTLAPELGRVGTSVVRIAVLMGAVAAAPPAARWVSDRVERFVFVRTTTASALRRRFAERLGSGRGLADLIESTCADISAALRARGVRVVVGRASEGREPVRLRVPLAVRGETVGVLLLGDRRDLLPYFDGERRLIDGISPQLAGAIAAFKRRQPAGVESGPDGRAHASETMARPATTDADRRAHAEPRKRRDLPGRGASVPALWRSEVTSAAARVGESDAEAGSVILRTLDRVEAHLAADTSDGPVRLDDEMDFARDLLALEGVRRNNRVQGSVRFPGTLSDQAVPRGVTLRLMTRILEDDVPSRRTTITVEVRVTQRDDRVHLEVVGQGIGALRADFPRRAVRGVGSA